MPPEAIIVVSAVIIAFCLLMGTLGWALWYTRALPRLDETEKRSSS